MTITKVFKKIKKLNLPDNHFNIYLNHNFINIDYKNKTLAQINHLGKIVNYDQIRAKQYCSKIAIGELRNLITCIYMEFN